MKKALIICLLIFTFFKGFGQDYHSIKDSIQSILDKKEIPGAFLTVVDKDSVLFQEGFGFAAVDKKELVDSNHLFRLGSVTKTFTALAIMKLVQDGKLSLESELKNIAPEIPFDNKWEETHPIKIKHLLTHRSGFDDFHISTLANITNRPKGTTLFEEVLYFQNSYKSNWKPGLVQSYSNPGYVILGYIIEKISGKSYQSYMREQIFLPLGMGNTQFISEITSSGNIKTATGYSKSNGSLIQVPSKQNLYGETGGGLMSNAEDMGKFLQYFLNPQLQDSLNVMNKEGIMKMEQLQNQFESDNDIKTGYSLGLEDRQFGNPERNFKGHSGLIDGYVTNFIYSREENIGIVVSSNLFGKSNRSIVHLLVNAFCETGTAVSELYPILESADLNQFKEWEGKHRQLNEDNEIYHFLNFPIRTKKIKIQGNKLLLTEFLGDTQEFYHVGGNAFKDKDELLPAVYLTEFEGKKSIYYYDTSFVRTSSLAYSLIKNGLIVSLLMGILLILLSIIQLLLFLLKKVKGDKLLRTSILALPHMMIIGSSILFFVNYSSYESVKNLGQLTFSSVALFLLTSLFPIVCLVAGAILFRQWKGIKKRIDKLFYGLSLFSCLFMTVYCITLGWFALQLWSY